MGQISKEKSIFFEASLGGLIEHKEVKGYGWQSLLSPAGVAMSEDCGRHQG